MPWGCYSHGDNVALLAANSERHFGRGRRPTVVTTRQSRVAGADIVLQLDLSEGVPEPVWRWSEIWDVPNFVGMS